MLWKALLQKTAVKRPQGEPGSLLAPTKTERASHRCNSRPTPGQASALSKVALARPQRKRPPAPLRSTQARNLASSRRMVHVQPRTLPSGYPRAHRLHAHQRRAQGREGGALAVGNGGASRARARRRARSTLGPVFERAPAPCIDARRCRTTRAGVGGPLRKRFHTGLDAMQHRDRQQVIAGHHGRPTAMTGKLPGALSHCHETGWASRRRALPTSA